MLDSFFRLSLWVSLSFSIRLFSLIRLFILCRLFFAMGGFFNTTTLNKGFISICFVSLLYIWVFLTDTLPLITPAKNPVGSPSRMKYLSFLTKLTWKWEAAFKRYFSFILFKKRNFWISEKRFNKVHIFYSNLNMILFLLLGLCIKEYYLKHFLNYF